MQFYQDIDVRGGVSSLTEFFTEVRETLFPPRTGKDGPLPLFLVLMTLVTGLVDAFSFLALGHIFVANMTGNVVFIAFALAGAPGFSAPVSVTALVAFIVGSFGGGALGSHLGGNRGRLLGISAGIQTIFLAISLVMASLSGNPISGAYLYGLTIPLAVSMGIQNATARRLAVPDLTTTVLTLTIVGIGADSHAVGGPGSRAGRRILSVTSMFAGAAIGALMVLNSSMAYPLVFAFAIIAVVALAAWATSKENPAWVQQR
jgi:uncharacterized membrane protein YoaK (UPF0700 family)